MKKKQMFPSVLAGKKMKAILLLLWTWALSRFFLTMKSQESYLKGEEETSCNLCPFAAPARLCRDVLAFVASYLLNSFLKTIHIVAFYSKAALMGKKTVK